MTNPLNTIAADTAVSQGAQLATPQMQSELGTPQIAAGNHVARYGQPQPAQAGAVDNDPNGGFLAPSSSKPNPAHLQVIRNRFLRNFDRVDVEDAVITDTSGQGKLPHTHLHIRFHMPQDTVDKLTPYERLVFMAQETDRGKFILNQYGLNYHEEANFEKYKGILQYDCDFSGPIENKTEMLRAIETDLQKGIDEARQSRGAALGNA